MHWRRKWQPTPVFLPGESQGRGSLVGCCLWGGTESDTTEVTYQGYIKSFFAQSSLTLCDPMDCSLSGSSVHGIFQARVLEWIAISFSRGSSRPRKSNPGLPRCRQTLYRLSHQENDLLVIYLSDMMESNPYFLHSLILAFHHYS